MAGFATSHKAGNLARRIRKLSVERDCAESHSQQYRWLALTPNLLRLALRTQPRSWPTARFTDNLWMHRLGSTVIFAFALGERRTNIFPCTFSKPSPLL